MTLPNEAKYYDKEYFEDTYFYEEVRCGIHAGIIIKAMGISGSDKPMLDVGGGPGTIVEWVRKLGFKGVNSDFSPDCNPDVLCGCDDLPFSDKEFSVVHSSDLLEHLEFDTIHKTIAECERVAEWQLHHIMVTEEGDKDDCEHHITIKPWSWWINEFTKHGLFPSVEWGWYTDPYPNLRAAQLSLTRSPKVLRLLLFKNH
jgi:hypothetical protein